MSISNSNRAKIHIAVKDTGMSRQTYLDILWNRYRVRSSSDLNDTQAAELLREEFGKRRGWQPKTPATVKDGRSATRRKDDNFLVIPPGPYARMQRKVLAMWNELGYDVAKLHARCKRQWNVDRFEWLQDYEALHVLITDLEARGR